MFIQWIRLHSTNNWVLISYNNLSRTWIPLRRDQQIHWIPGQMKKTDMLYLKMKTLHIRCHSEGGIEDSEGDGLFTELNFHLELFLIENMRCAIDGVCVFIQFFLCKLLNILSKQHLQSVFRSIAHWCQLTISKETEKTKYTF